MDKYAVIEADDDNKRNQIVGPFNTEAEAEACVTKLTAFNNSIRGRTGWRAYTVYLTNPKSLDWTVAG